MASIDNFFSLTSHCEVNIYCQLMAFISIHAFFAVFTENRAERGDKINHALPTLVKTLL